MVCFSTNRPTKKTAVGLLGSLLTANDEVHLGRNRHVYTGLSRESAHDWSGFDTLGNLVHFCSYFGDRFAFAELLTEEPIATLGANAGCDQVTHAS